MGSYSRIFCDMSSDEPSIWFEHRIFFERPGSRMAQDIGNEVQMETFPTSELPGTVDLKVRALGEHFMNSKVLSGWTLFWNRWAFWAQKQQVCLFDSSSADRRATLGVQRPDYINKYI